MEIKQSIALILIIIGANFSTSASSNSISQTIGGIMLIIGTTYFIIYSESTVKIGSKEVESG